MYPSFQLLSEKNDSILFLEDFLTEMSEKGTKICDSNVLFS